MNDVLECPRKGLFLLLERSRFAYFQTDFQISLAWALLALKKSKEIIHIEKWENVCKALSLDS